MSAESTEGNEKRRPSAIGTEEKKFGEKRKTAPLFLPADARKAHRFPGRLRKEEGKVYYQKGVKAMRRIAHKFTVTVLAFVLVLSISVVSFADTAPVISGNGTVATANGLTMRFGDPDYPETPPESNMRFAASGSNLAVSYENGIPNFYPDTLAFYVTEGAEKISNMTGNGVTVLPTGSNKDKETVPMPDNWNTGFYILYIETATPGVKTLTITTNNQKSVTLNFTVPAMKPSTGSKLIAYLPAPGQFVNEGIKSGGWGDAYDSTGALKNNNPTGMSLGFFGGYAIFDMGLIERDDHNVYMSGGVKNSSTTPYGTDFIVFGNAFWGNSEPGCVQVSKDGTNWYDIAGSKYYDPATVRDESITYYNPNVSEDARILEPEDRAGSLASIEYKDKNGVKDTINKNNFHMHSWFPLNANYFMPRTAGGRSIDGLDTYRKIGGRKLSNGVTKSLTLTGVRLGEVDTRNTHAYQFGYPDVHPNKTLGGTVSYNPYTPMASSGDWNAVAGGSSGGDPIDISWAVNKKGEPVQLDAIRYVRVYTGVAQNNGIFGEVSTEVCGISVCTGATSETPSVPTVYVGDTAVSTSNGKISTVKGLGTSAININVEGSGNIYINGEYSASESITPTSAGAIVQVITQNGTSAPYITWLRLVS